MIELLSWFMRLLLLCGALGAAGHVAVFLIHGVVTPRVVLAACAGFAAIGGFAVQAAALTGTMAGAFDLLILGLLWSTGLGAALVLHVIGALGLILGVIIASRLLQAVGAIALLAGFLPVGHVADLPGWVLTGCLALHLILAAYWIGVLWPLYRLAGTAPDEAALLGERFGRLALYAVPSLIALGTVIAITLLDHPTQLWTTSYGAALSAKIVAVSAMLALGAMNKLRHLPALRRGHSAALRKSLACEGAGAFAVLSATAAFSTIAGLG